MWIQKTITLSKKHRGFHLITEEILNNLTELSSINQGIAHFFIQHTSASLTINENADPDVRHDMELHFNHSVPENAPYYQHILEGSDDMPAHIKASILGSSITIPISKGYLALGIWQGIYLGKHRNTGERRNIIATIMGN